MLDPFDAPPGYKAVEVRFEIGCKGCAFDSDDHTVGYCTKPPEFQCAPKERPDKTDVIFKKIEATENRRAEDRGPGVTTDPYQSLSNVLQRAHDQAAHGKGAERHATGQPFDEQPMQKLIALYGIGFALGQAAKKMQEAQRLPTVDRQVAELLGAINYIAGAVISLERDRDAA